LGITPKRRKTKKESDKMVESHKYCGIIMLIFVINVLRGRGHGKKIAE